MINWNTWKMIEQRYTHKDHNFYIRGFFEESGVTWVRWKGRPRENERKVPPKKLPYGWLRDSIKDFENLMASQGWECKEVLYYQND